MIGDKIRIFLDNNSTTPRDERVLEYMMQVEQRFFGNASSQHLFGWEADEIILIAKEKISSLVSCDPSLIFFTSGATEANNLAIKGFSKRHLASTPFRILTSTLEHSSVLSPINDLEVKGEVTVDFLRNDTFGKVIFDSHQAPAFISLQIANNEIGTIQPVDELRSLYANSFIHSDCVQMLGKLSFDFSKLNINCMSISAHKMHGPIGIGALIFKDEASSRQVGPLFFGGGQQNEKRPGTLPTALIAGFGEAAALAQKELHATYDKLSLLSTVFLRTLKEQFKEIEVIGEALESRLPGNLSIRLINVNADTLLASLATRIAFSTGSACQGSKSKSSHVLLSLNLPKHHEKEIIRIGISKLNTEEEIVFAAKEIAKEALKIRALNK